MSPDGLACADTLLVTHDLQQLALRTEALALEKLPCVGALCRVADLGPFGSAVARTAEAEILEVPLANGRARLELEFPRGCLDGRVITDADCAWIDRVDLRMREFLDAREQQDIVHTALRSEQLQKALYAIASLAHSPLDFSDMFARIHEVIRNLTYAENFFVALYDDERDVMRLPYYADSEDTDGQDPQMELHAADYVNSLTFKVLHTGQVLWGDSSQLREQLNLKPDPRLGPESVDWMGIPMIDRERVLGAIVVQSYDHRHRYSERDRDLLIFVAQHVISALVRKQAREELEREVHKRTRELAEANRSLREEVEQRLRAQHLQAAWYRIAELASEQTGIDAFYVGVHAVVAELLNAHNFFISVLNEDGSRISFPYFVDERDERACEPRQPANGMTEWVVNHKRPLLAAQAQIVEMMQAGEMVVFGTLPKCWLGVPLVIGERALGVMAVQSYEDENAYGPEEQEILLFASFHVATALERRQYQEHLRLSNMRLEVRVQQRTRELETANRDLLEQIGVRKLAESRLTHEALHDSLTGLPNRTALLQRLHHVLNRFRKDPTRLFAVLFLDLDRFKVVNDSVGHLLGDELLVEAGKRISGCVRGPDSVARLGGDEFTLLLEDIASAEDANRVARRALTALADPVRLGDKEIYTSASIGIAIANMRYTLPEELLRDADVAMYRAKARGRQRFEIFDEQLRQEALHTLDMESDLRRAITRQEFEPHLQPIVSLVDGQVLGYEALLRWRHAKRGLLRPADFLTVAEESGNVEQIDWQLYEQVCSAISKLHDPDAYVSINVSARHFRSPKLVHNLLGLLDAHHVPTRRVRIEITEGVLLADPEQARTTMLELRASGVLTVLDDFGTGYSSLSYLHRFPLHALKIDRSFVAELNADLSGSCAAVIRAIRALAGSLGMEVIAEGIETPVQCEALLRLECMIGQGFLFDQPRPVPELIYAS